jgi:hypothetical protein
MQKPPLDPDVADTAPSNSVLTVYDQEHIIAYLRLLDADADGADWRDVARKALHLDPEHEPDRARRAFDSHLSRQMDDGARLAAPATWWRVGLNQTWKMVAGSTCAISAVLGQEEPLPHLSGYQVHHRRGIISAASSCVGAMRRGTLRLQI